MRGVVQLADRVDVSLVEMKERSALVNHPSKSQIGKVLIWISSSDIRMNPREPTLLEIHSYTLKLVEGHKTVDRANLSTTPRSCPSEGA